MKATLDPVANKLFLKEERPSPKKKTAHRYLESKTDNRVKLPALSSTMANFKEDEARVASDKKNFTAID